MTHATHEGRALQRHLQGYHAGVKGLVGRLLAGARARDALRGTATMNVQYLSVRVERGGSERIAEIEERLSAAPIKMTIARVDAPRGALTGWIPRSGLPRRIEEIRKIPDVEHELMVPVFVTVADARHAMVLEIARDLEEIGMLVTSVTSFLGIIEGATAEDRIDALRRFDGVEIVERSPT